MRRAPLLALLVAALVPAFAARARGDDAPTRLPVPADLADEVRWYGGYLAGQKVGWVKETTERRGEGPDAVVVLGTEMRFELTALGRSTTMLMRDSRTFRAAPPHELLRAEAVESQGERENRVEVERTEAGYGARVTEAGETRELPVEGLDLTLEDALTEREWIRGKPAVGDSITIRAFEISDLEPDLVTSTVTAVRESIVGGVRMTWYETSGRTKRQGRVLTARFDDQGRALSAVLAEVFEFRAEPEETAKRLDAGGDLFVLGTAKVTGAIGDPTKVVDLVLEARGEGTAALLPAPRQGVSGDPETGVVLLSLGAAHGGEHRATEAETAEALRETVGLPVSHPEVVALAREALGDAATPREKVDRLVRFVASYIEDAVTIEVHSALELIREPRGDCSEHSLLFALLARASGIPAREVSGLMYMGDAAGAFGPHAWNEVVLDGLWTPVDAAWSQTEVDATHIALTRGTEQEGSGLAAFGRLEFTVRSVGTADADTPAKPCPFLWEATSGDTTVYLFGTIHLPDERVLDLPPSVRGALDRADAVHTELPMDAATQMKAATAGFLPAGQSLATVLPPDVYARLDAYLTGRGGNLGLFARMKVWAVAMTLQILDILPQLALRQALDAALYRQAAEQGKEVGGLETVEEQTGIFDALTAEEQVEMLTKTLDALEKDAAAGSNALEALVVAWLSGDESAVAAQLGEGMPEDTELGRRMKKRLLDDRNRLMVERLLAAVDADPAKVRFVAVGTAHHLGEGGIVDLLSEAGWTVRRMSADEPIASREPAPASSD
jgi:hypothetical protein